MNIVITVENGIVSIYTDNDDAEILLLDYDAKDDENAIQDPVDGKMVKVSRSPEVCAPNSVRKLFKRFEKKSRHGA